MIPGAFSQGSSIEKIIFVPHPRSDDTDPQSVVKEIGEINFSNYDMILLGGDLTQSTTMNYATLDYCDSLFDLGNPNTLWTMGNHDMSHPEYVPEYTHRPTFYAYNIQHMTFLVLNTELDANGFESCYISGEQLEMIQEVTDTLLNSKYLILLQHRLLWMIGNEDLEEHLDSVGQSTAQLDTSNFYQEVYPLLQLVKSKGIQIICLGGDRADLNIEYSPEDSITYLASAMVPAYPDTVNHVIVLTCNTENDSISWEFVSLADVEKNPVTLTLNVKEDEIGISSDPYTGEIIIQPATNFSDDMNVTVFDISGRCVYSEKCRIDRSSKRIGPTGKGIFMVRIDTGDAVFSEKVFLR
jgi:hypothetical protein